MATLDELKARLRRALGNVPTTQLSDEQLYDALDSALKEYSKYKPIYILDYLTSTKDVATYDLSSKEGIIKVKEVYYSRGPFEYFDEFWPDYSELGRLSGINIFEHPSIWTQFLQRVEQFEYIFECEFEFNQSTKTLRLIPPPDQTGKKIYFLYSKRHTAETVPEEDIEVLLLWARAEAKEMMAAKKSYEIRSVSGYGESVTLGSTPESLMSEAEELKKRFSKRFGSSAFVVG